MYKLLFFTLLISQISFANNQYLWKIQCETNKFPTKFISRKYLYSEQFDVQSCFAEQIKTQSLNGRQITSIAKITPARIFFTTENITDRYKNAKLIIGEKQKIFTLYSNCYKNSCLLFPEDKNQNIEIINEIKRNQEFFLEIIDNQTKILVKFVFQSGNFEEIYPLIESAYKQMEEIIRLGNIS